MKIFDFENAQGIAAGGHRGDLIKMQVFPCFTDCTGNNFLISVARLPEGRFSPLHRHNFDQVRFILSGSSDYGGWNLTAGECGYFPESVAYGPQRQHEAAHVLTLQFPGDSAAYYPTPSELDLAVERLKADDPAFGQGGVGAGDDGVERDAFELAWEAIQGEQVRYAAPRYDAPIVMKPANFNSRRDGQGRETRHLGTFGDSRLRIAMVSLSGGQPFGIGSRTEFWFLVAGNLHWQGADYGPRTGFLFDGDETPLVPATAAAEFLVITFPERRATQDGRFIETQSVAAGE